jgi:iron(III) transport system substrate-binding protein
MVEKLSSGEYVTGFFISGIVIFPKLEQLGQVLGWNYIKDGTPLFLRGMAIPKGSTNVNAAKLMLDFILSHAGQVAFGKGRLTPYRPDVTTDEVPLNYNSVVDAIGGEQNVIYVNYDEKMLSGYEAFIARWKKAFGL